MSEGFTVSARQTGRPAALTGDRERECYELLERLGIAYEWVEFSRQPETTAEAEEVDKALGVPGLKNLIFQNRNRSRTLFLLLPREKRLDAKALAKSRNITRLSMVNAAALEDLLHTHAGAVGAMELMYDMEGKLELFIDREVLDGPFVRFPPNADGRLVRIATSDFVDKLLPAIKHGYTVLEADDRGALCLPEDAPEPAAAAPVREPGDPGAEHLRRTGAGRGRGLSLCPAHELCLPGGEDLLPCRPHRTQDRCHCPLSQGQLLCGGSGQDRP